MFLIVLIHFSDKRMPKNNFLKNGIVKVFKSLDPSRLTVMMTSVFGQCYIYGETILRLLELIFKKKSLKTETRFLWKKEYTATVH